MISPVDILALMREGRYSSPIQKLPSESVSRLSVSNPLGSVGRRLKSRFVGIEKLLISEMGRPVIFSPSIFKEMISVNVADFSGMRETIPTKGEKVGFGKIIVL